MDCAEIELYPNLGNGFINAANGEEVTVIFLSWVCLEHKEALLNGAKLQINRRNLTQVQN